MDVKVEWTTPMPDAAAVRAAVARALGEVADVCLEDANRTIPFEVGDLADSGHTSVDAGSLTAQVAYASVYAVVQHEDTSFHHKYGRDHWLEKTVNENEKRYSDYIADAVRRAT